MPLSDPAPRGPAHHRNIDLHGYRRDDGLWDIEAHLVDSKPFPIANQDRGGAIAAGEPIHEMWVRLTIDMDFLIHDAEAATDWAPYHVCPEIAPRFKRLRGLRIEPGWNARVRGLFKGVDGCTHLTELLGPLATTAFQTLWPARNRRDAERGADSSRRAIVGTCHALAADGPVVSRWHGTPEVELVSND